MRISLLTTVSALATLCWSGPAGSEDSPELQKTLTDWKTLINVEPRKLGRKGREAISIIERISGRKGQETRLVTRAAEASVRNGLRNRIPFISGAAFNNSHCVFRFPTPKGHRLESGSAVRLALRGNHSFRGGREAASKKLTIAFLHDNDYRVDWKERALGPDCHCRLIIEKDRLALAGRDTDPVWQSLKDTSWKQNQQNDLTFVVTSSAIEFWLNGKRTALEPIDNPPPLNWIHVSVPHIYWGFNRFSFLQRPKAAPAEQESNFDREGER